MSPTFAFLRENAFAMILFRFSVRLSALRQAGPLCCFFFLLVLAACSNIETVDNTDENGQREHYQRRKKDFAKEGFYQRFRADGSKAEEANYLNDSLQGERKYFYPNGKVESIEHYQMGVIHGKFEAFYEDGTHKVEQTFVNGALEGESLAYYPNGQLKERVMLKNNDENGPFTEYYENGKLKAEGSYLPSEDGPLEEGELKEYDENGELIRIADCKQGVCLTRWKKQ